MNAHRCVRVFVYVHVPIHKVGAMLADRADAEQTANKEDERVNEVCFRRPLIDRSIVHARIR